MKKFTRTEKKVPLHAIAIETEAEKERFNRLLDDGHYLKSRQPSGHTLYQAVLDESGEWVAVVLWCGGSYRIDPRDRFIGWDSRKREDFLLVRHPMALLNCTLLVNAAAFITDTLRKQRKTSTPALRENFGRRPSLALRILTSPFYASLAS